MNANVHSKRELIIFRKIIIRTYGFDSLSDDQVRFILGHELAHIRQNHEWNLFNLFLSLLFGVFLFLLIFVAIFSSLFLAIVLGGIASGIYSYYFYKNSQRKELEADEIGFLAAGGGECLLEEISKLMEQFESSKDPFFNSHPSPDRRNRELIKFEEKNIDYSHKRLS